MCPSAATGRAPPAVLGTMLLVAWGVNGRKTTEFQPHRHNEPMVLAEAAVVLALVGLAFYVMLRLVTGRGSPRDSTGAAAGPGKWRTTYYDVKGVTRVVVQKVSPGGTNILNEHVVATISTEDADYDAKFLAATATARERRAMFEAEEG